MMNEKAREYARLRDAGRLPALPEGWSWTYSFCVIRGPHCTLTLEDDLTLSVSGTDRIPYPVVAALFEVREMISQAPPFEPLLETQAVPGSNTELDIFILNHKGKEGQKVLLGGLNLFKTKKMSGSGLRFTPCYRFADTLPGLQVREDELPLGDALEDKLRRAYLAAFKGGKL